MAGKRAPGIDFEEDVERETRHAPLYKVLLHNDDVTPFLFVQHEVCEGIFHMDAGRAYRVTSEVHHTGIGLAGVYPLEQAEFKCDQVRSLARGRGYPLRVSTEPA
jgi:ATP-dependent Clp protease adaptor protein ClpS